MTNNLLNLGPTKAIVKNGFFPLALQILNLVMTVLLIRYGFGVSEEALRYTNFTSFLVWVIWWPVLVFGVLFAARSWCTVCHLRLISKYAGKLGLNLKLPESIIKHGTSVTILMVLGVFVLHSSVVSYHVNHFGDLTAWYLIILMAYVFVVALLFEQGSFCKSFCPLVGFLGPYARVSPTELRTADEETCMKCKAKECVKNCSNKLYMGNLDNNEGCLLCFECVKKCPEDNIRFSLRPFLKDLWYTTKRSLAPALAVIVLLGILFEEVGEEWALVEEVIVSVPKAFIELTGIPGDIFGSYHWIESIWFQFGFPILIVGITAILAKIFARKGSIIEYVEIYTVGFIPLLLTLHITKHWHKFNGKIGYLPHVLKDPSGINTAAGLSAKTLAQPRPLLMSGTTEGWFLIALVATGLLSSLYVVYKISKRSFEDESSVGTRSAIPFHLTISLTGIVFLMTIYNWFEL